MSEETTASETTSSGTTASQRRFGKRRRRRRGSGPPRGLYLLPHLVTTAGLYFGFFAIIQAFGGKPDLAALGIVLAGVCDTLDGRLARIANSSSRFGVEYDSIADTVSFGVAPAMLAFSAGNLQVLGRTGWVMAFLFTACAALRLARFNVSPSRYKGRFEGLPSPAAAGVVASTQWFGSFMAARGAPFALPEAFVAGGMAVLGLLMVSAIPYRSGKEMDLRHSYGTLVLVLFVLALVVVEPSVSLFLIGIVYTSSGPIEWLWRRRAGKPLEVIPEPEPEPEVGRS